MWALVGLTVALIALLTARSVTQKRHLRRRYALGPPPRDARQRRIEYLSAQVPGTIDEKDLAFVGSYEGVSFRLQLLESPQRTLIESALRADDIEDSVVRAAAREDVAASLADLRGHFEWKDGLLRLSRDGWPHDAVVVLALIRALATVRHAIDEEQDAADRSAIPGAAYRNPGDDRGAG